MNEEVSLTDNIHPSNSSMLPNKDSNTAGSNIKYPDFDPSTFMTKAVFELNHDNFLIWQTYVKNILECYGLEERINVDKTEKVYSPNTMNIDGKEYYKSPYEKKHFLILRVIKDQ
ncbi:hypothetical protein BCR32DRAFT_248689 [Anaeromyces robustus]|uniref:Uncharacterized protein n=1 Tax=Anaeromyces robustus TaxID=1754192 RepID=A0A1Y1WSL3_9FUNG|nr:hypothetical protein BCR32DRAFT_248689 [Anaeromyces robustus]|eukprot:ORX76523.1 hypothetical protein BCR32DRAFT_248689 [Anaeromyces robustus]